uniref:Uncharacterized protein n=1 Tax=Candidatus Kentrum sp. LFY TaxID=2126342 RepID=A0A450WYX1_9GAMM|nr:MAG: hypothetical protein BECKLFY1418C_GA0070996_11137 [Candidatus Kentron sp. LFY]
MSRKVDTIMMDPSPYLHNIDKIRSPIRHGERKAADTVRAFVFNIANARHSYVPEPQTP